MNFKVFQIPLIIALVFNFVQLSYSQVINYDTKVIISEKGIKTVNKTVLMQINDKQSNKLSHVEIRHNPKQKFSLDYAKILDINGNTLRKLKKKEIISRSDFSYGTFYQDDVISEFDLYWNQYPYRIEYSYTISEEEFFSVIRWSPQMYLNIPTLKGSLEIVVPDDYKLNISQTDDLVYEESKQDNSIKYFWKASAFKKLSNELHSPPFEDLVPVVWVMPSLFKYGVDGTSDSWASFGLWQDNLNEGTDELPPIEKIIISDLVEGINDEREIIKKIYHYMQDQTRYINVAIDVGGLKSYPASYVCKNKYGDCKALTTYMKAMLKSVGIASYYTIVNAGANKTKIKEDFPGQQFNHVILAVPLENDTIWLENTTNALPFNYLGTFTQNRPVLLTNREESILIRTPKLLPPDVLLKRNYAFNISNENIWQGDVILKLRGDAFEDYRYFWVNNKKQKQKEEILKHIDIDQFTIDHWNIQDYHRDSTSISIQVNGKLTNPIREIGNLKVIKPLRINIPNFEKPGERKSEVRIPFPINQMDKSVYQLGVMESKLIEMPDSITIDSKYGQYSTSYTIDDTELIISENFTLFTIDVLIDQYEEFYSFLQSIINYKKKSAILIK